MVKHVGEIGFPISVKTVLHKVVTHAYVCVSIRLFIQIRYRRMLKYGFEHVASAVFLPALFKRAVCLTHFHNQRVTETVYDVLMQVHHVEECILKTLMSESLVLLRELLFLCSQLLTGLFELMALQGQFLFLKNDSENHAGKG